MTRKASLLAFKEIQIQKEEQGRAKVSDTCIKAIFDFIIYTDRSPRPRDGHPNNIKRSIYDLYDFQYDWLGKSKNARYYQHHKALHKRETHTTGQYRFNKNQKEFGKEYAMMKTKHIRDARKGLSVKQHQKDPYLQMESKILNVLQLSESRGQNWRDSYMELIRSIIQWMSLTGLTIPQFHDNFERRYMIEMAVHIVQSADFQKRRDM